MGLITILFYIFVLWLLYDFIKKNRKLSNKDPKSPWALPILGHLHLFGIRPHRSFTELSKSYGGIFTLWLGDERSMVVTDPNILRELFIKQSSIFTNRPFSNSVDIYSGGYKDLSFANGELWRANRKLVSSALTKTKIISVIYSIETQARHLVGTMNFYAKSEQPFYPHNYLSKYTLNIVMNMGFSKTISPDEDVDQGAMARLTVPFFTMLTKLGSGNLDDYIWFIKPLYYFENKNYKKQVKEVYTFLEELYDEHISTIDKSNPRDLMDQLILATDFKGKDTCIHVSLDFLLAGSDTNASTIEWLCLFFANYPEIQEKAYNELISVVGKNCTFVDYKHKDSCNYLFGAIKETLRMRTPAPLALMRVADEDYTTTNGVYIPKGTQIIPNIFGIAQNYVDDPLTFKPERWVEYYKKKQETTTKSEDSTAQKQTDSKNYYNDLDNVVLPFSVGIRSCPGNIISLDYMLFIACSNILLNFEISSDDGNKINETEIFGVTIHPTIFPLKLTKRN